MEGIEQRGKGGKGELLGAQTQIQIFDYTQIVFLHELTAIISEFE